MLISPAGQRQWAKRTVPPMSPAAISFTPYNKRKATTEVMQAAVEETSLINHLAFFHFPFHSLTAQLPLIRTQNV